MSNVSMSVHSGLHASSEREGDTFLKLETKDMRERE